MKLVVEKSGPLKGEISIPGSKSHSIRAVILASLAEGTSIINNLLISEDVNSSINACRKLGAQINKIDDKKWEVVGFGKSPKPKIKQGEYLKLDMGNSGTSARLFAGICSVFDFKVEIDGDDSLRTRPMQELLNSLTNLGATAYSVNGDGKCPIRIEGKITGGETSINGITSQFVSAVLLAAPLAEKNTRLTVPILNEIPYFYMTINWMKQAKIKIKKLEYPGTGPNVVIEIEGNQEYNSFKDGVTIPADWSSATFPIIAAAIIPGSNVMIKGLDKDDVQGDKAVLDYLKEMGADIEESEDGIRVLGTELKGKEINLNATPDALPAMAVLGCFAKGETKLYNVEQARIKETDRIKLMSVELGKMGASTEELDDGLIISESTLNGANVNGYSDHRIVMALGLAGLIADGETNISTAEAVSVTFPNFVELMKSLGANIRLEEEE